MRRRAPLVLLTCAGFLAVLLSGCSSASKPDVEKVAGEVENPTVDAGSRCALLAPTAGDRRDAWKPREQGPLTYRWDRVAAFLDELVG